MPEDPREHLTARVAWLARWNQRAGAMTRRHSARPRHRVRIIRRALVLLASNSGK